MLIKSLFTCVILKVQPVRYMALVAMLFLANPAQATLIDNGSITYDDVSGLEWLDLSITTNRSYSDISSQLGVGGEFEGWRYATLNQVSDLWVAAGADSTNFDGWSAANEGIVEILASYLGDCEIAAGVTRCLGLTADSVTSGSNLQYSVQYYDDSNTGLTQDYLKLPHYAYDNNFTSYLVGSYLVRENVVAVNLATTTNVPEPTALILLSLSLLGLACVRRQPNKLS